MDLDADRLRHRLRGMLWSQKGKSAAVTAIAISTVGSIGSFVVLMLGLMVALSFHYLPN